MGLAYFPAVAGQAPARVGELPKSFICRPEFRQHSMEIVSEKSGVGVHRASSAALFSVRRAQKRLP